MTTHYPCFPGSGSTGYVTQEPQLNPPCRIGLALGGGFARGIAHAGVLKVLEERNIPIHCIAGVSAGSVAAAAFSSGASAAEIAEIPGFGPKMAQELHKFLLANPPTSTSAD